MKTAKKTPAQRAREALNASRPRRQEAAAVPTSLAPAPRYEIPAGKSMAEQLGILNDLVRSMDGEMRRLQQRVLLLESHTMETANAVLSGHRKVEHIVRYHMARR